MYNEQERQIFEYFNGIRQVKGDPLTIHRKLVLGARTEGKDLEQLINVVMNPPVPSKKKKKEDTDNESLQQSIFYESVETLLSLVRSAFGVKPVEEDGLTETETLVLLAEFINYMGSLKKNTETSVSSSPSTDTPQPWEKKVLPLKCM